MQDMLTVFDLDNAFKISRLNGEWKEIHSVSVFPDEILIFYTNGRLKDARTCIRGILGDNYKCDKHNEFAIVGRMEIPLSWHEETENSKPIPYHIQPLLQDSVLLTDPEKAKTAIDESVFNMENLNHPGTDDSEPQLIAFFSFKGGVGRTMHMTALAQRLADTIESTASSPKILLVDADTEAPGISWWIKDEIPEYRYSYLDFLGEATIDAEQAVKTAADLVKTMCPDLGNQQKACYFLPAFRDETQLLRPPAKPAQLTSQKGKPWLLGDVLSKLGKELGVQYVFIDLRAGLTELSSPLLLDPRVTRFFVTSASRQSVEGTILSLEAFGKFTGLFPDEIKNRYAEKTQIILGFCHRDESSNDSLVEIELNLNSTLRKIFHADEDDSREWCLRSYFDWTLLNLAGFKESLELFEKANSLQETCEKIIPSLLTDNESQSETNKPSFGKDDLERLKNFAGDLVFAENPLKTSGFLVIDSYRQLAKRFLNEAPNAVIVGAKGSGKTFFLKTLAGMNSWSEFCRKCGLNGAADAKMIPLIWSANENKDPFINIQAKELNSLGYAWDNDEGEKLGRQFGDSFRIPATGADSGWREKWLRVFCAIFNIDFDADASCEPNLKNYVGSLEKSVVFLIDGLEDLFADWIKPSSGIEPLRILLQDILRDLNKWSRGRIGLLIFIRKDIVRNAIQQNSEQFLSPYKNYELRWSKEEALRLVGWALSQAGFKQFGDSELDDNWAVSGYDELEKKLHPLWGAKMGSQKSREANTASWVLSAISDFKGNFQARDIIRLLDISAKLQIGKNQIPPDRILAPIVLRNAMTECGNHKIEETELEIPAIKNELQTLKENKPTIPISSATLEEIEIHNIALLEELGIFFRDEDKYYLPEIYRRGLGLNLDAGARPKVVSLMRKALAKAGL